MRKIYKYALEIVDRQALYIPGHAKLLDVQIQNGVPCLWALVDTNEEERERVIQIFGTGHPAEEAGAYVATFQFGLSVFHVFEE